MLQCILSIPLCSFCSFNYYNNNCYYQPNRTGSPIAHPDYANYAAWQAAGYDANSIQTDPELTNYVPSTTSPTKGVAEDLGTDFETGLNSATDWGEGTSLPSVVKEDQGVDWNMGAYVS